MMKLFKNRKVRESPTSDELAQKIAINIMGWQSRTAGYLNGKTKHLSGKTWLFILIGFCAVFGSYLLYLLISALN